MAGKDMGTTLRDAPDFFLTINLSARDLQSGGTLEKLMVMARDSGARPGQIVAELTERMLVDASAAKRSAKEGAVVAFKNAMSSTSLSVSLLFAIVRVVLNMYDYAASAQPIDRQCCHAANA